MLIIGLAGGVASGKSFVAEQFRALGARVLDADSLGHEVLKDQETAQQITSALGDSVIDSQGNLDREKIAAIVFGAGEFALANLEKLESISHPKISALIEKRLGEYRTNSVPATVLDAPVMFKAGWDKFCDKIVYVEASYEVRLKRAKSRGWTEEQFSAREASQTPIEVKRSRATDVIDNDVDSQDVSQRIKQLWQEWKLPQIPDHEVPANALH